MGYLNKNLSPDDKQEPLGLIEAGRKDRVPLIVPLMLFQRHLLRHPVPGWVWEPAYLRRYPTELMLRNHL